MYQYFYEAPKKTGNLMKYINKDLNILICMCYILLYNMLAFPSVKE